MSSHIAVEGSGFLCVKDMHADTSWKACMPEKAVLVQDQIQRVREPVRQIDDMHVPENALNGHAFHTYHLKSPDGTVDFEFQHNVCGRQIYAEGTVDAALFLAARVAEQSSKRIFNMIDVLKAGAMR